MTTSNPHSNPVTTEIIRNAFNAIAEDMNASLIRSAFTPIIYEGKDCAVGLLDENGDVLGQSLGLPLFLGNLSLCVQIIAEMKGWDYYEEGDVVLLNDSYIAGTHLNDITVIMPIFWEGKRIGFATSRAHWLDVGAKDAGSPTDAREIYQEGMRWPPTKVYRKGVAQDDILAFMRANSRFGDALIGDLHAQIAAGRTGEMRMRALIDRFGYETVQAARDDIFAQSAELERQAILAIPDGEYTAEGALDNDGISTDPVPVKLTVRVSGETMEMDLTGSSKQTVGGVNCGFTQTVSALRVAFKLLINPERPVDGGTFRALNIVAPEGTIFHAAAPAACSWYFSSLGMLIDMVVKALAPALPQRAAAALPPPASPPAASLPRALRRFDGHHLQRHRRAQRRCLLRCGGGKLRRLGRMERRRRAGLPDQQRQRQLPRLSDRGVRTPLSDADHQVRHPPGQRR